MDNFTDFPEKKTIREILLWHNPYWRRLPLLETQLHGISGWNQIAGKFRSGQVEIFAQVPHPFADSFSLFQFREPDPFSPFAIEENVEFF